MKDNTPPATAKSLEQAILDLLQHRRCGATICPSEVARAIDATQWQPLMQPIRDAARRLVESGRVEITQRGRVIDPAEARGPIRIRLSVPDASRGKNQKR